MKYTYFEDDHVDSRLFIPNELRIKYSDHISNAMTCNECQWGIMDLKSKYVFALPKHLLSNESNRANPFEFWFDLASEGFSDAFVRFLVFVNDHWPDHFEKCFTFKTAVRFRNTDDNFNRP